MHERSSHIPTNSVLLQFLLTSLACTFCFLISDQVMFSREFSFCFLISYSYISTSLRPHLKETVLLSDITWSEMEKQKVQAKEVNSQDHCAVFSVYPNWEALATVERTGTNNQISCCYCENH